MKNVKKRIPLPWAIILAYRFKVPKMPGKAPKHLLLWLFLITFSAGSAWAQVDFQRIKEVTGLTGCSSTTNSKLFHTIEGSDKNFYAAGSAQCNSSGAALNAMLIRYDADGNVGSSEWTKTYFPGEFNDVIENHNSELVSVGYTSTTPEKLAIQKTQKNGTSVVANTYDNGTNSQSVGRAIIEVKDATNQYDGYLAVGFLGDDLYLVRTMDDITVPSGSTTYWEKTYKITGKQLDGLDVLQNANGNFVVAATADNDILVLEIDRLGNIVAKNRITQPTCKLEGYAVDQTSSGYVITGNYLYGTPGSWNSKGLLIKLNSSLGVTEFRQVTHATNNVYLGDAYQESNGDFVITGYRDYSTSFIARLSGASLTTQDYPQPGFISEIFCLEPAALGKGYILSGFARNSSATTWYPYILKTQANALACGNSPLTLSTNLQNTYGFTNTDVISIVTTAQYLTLNPAGQTPALTATTGCSTCVIATPVIYGSDRAPNRSLDANVAVELWTDAVPGATYEWTESGSGTVLSTSTSLWVYDDGTASSKTYQLKISITPGCTATATKTVYQLDYPTGSVGATVDFSSACDGNGFMNFTNLCVSYDFTYNYFWYTSGDPDWLWDFGDPGSANNSATTYDASHQYNNPGDYMVTLKIMPHAGGTLYVRHTVHIGAAPTATLSAPSVDCSQPDGYKTTFTADVTNWDNSFTYSINGPVQIIGSPTTNQTNHTWHAQFRVTNESFAGTMVFQTRNSSCRWASANITVQRTKATLTFYPPVQYVAKGAPFNLADWPWGINNYSFSGQYSFASPSASITFTPGSPQNTYTLNSAGTPLNVLHPISFTFRLSDMTCSYTQTQNYYPSTADMEVYVFDPQITVTSSASSICPGGSVTLTANVSTLPSVVGCNIEWYGPSGLIRTDQGVTTSQLTVSNITSTSNYYAKAIILHQEQYIGGNGDGSWPVNSNTVTVNTYPTHTFILTTGGSTNVTNGTVKVCDIANAPNISIIVTNPTGGTSPYTYTYQWIRSGGILESTDPSHVPQYFGLYTVKVTANSSNHSCEVINNVYIQDNHPVASITDPAVNYMCSGSSITLHGTYVSGATYNWYYRPNSSSPWSVVFTGLNYTTSSFGDYYYEAVNPTPSCTTASNIVSVLEVPDLTLVSNPSGGGWTLNLTAGSANISNFYTNVELYQAGVSTPVATLYPPYSYSTGTAGYYYVEADKCGLNSARSNTVKCAASCTPTPTTYTNYSFPSGSTTSITTPSVFEGNITVPAGAIVQISADITMQSHGPDCAQIIVEPEGRLEIDGATISAPCEIWKGITVEGNASGSHSTTSYGSLYMSNGAAIKDAIVAVYSKDGGYLNIDASDFEDNGMHIAFGAYAYDNQSIITDHCSFGTLVLNMATISCGSPFSSSHTMTGQPMIFMEDVQDITVSNGNTFTGTSSPGMELIGIEIYNSHISTTTGNGVSIIGNGSTFNSGSTFDGNFNTCIYAMKTDPASVCEGVYISGNVFGCDYTNPALCGPTGAHPVNGIILKDASNCIVGDRSSKGSGRALDGNLFGYVTTGLQYYSTDGSAGTTKVYKNDFYGIRDGIVIAPEVYPITTGTPGACGSINYQPNQLNIEMFCNKFAQTRYGIVGAGNLMQQGAAPPTNNYTADNNFLGIFANKADLLWYGGGNYYYNSSGGLPSNLSPGSSEDINYCTVTSSSIIGALNSFTSYNCYGTWKRDLSVKEEFGKDVKQPSLYPNPSHANFMLALPSLGASNLYKIEVTDFIGQKVYNTSTDGSHLEVNCETWKPGAYSVKITDKDGRYTSIIFVKQ